MGHTEMARDNDSVMIKLMRWPGESSAEPGFSAMLCQKAGMKDRAIAKGVFQQAVDSGAAGAGKVNEL